jgi:sugar phosphate isomerase/epimerase
MTSHPLPSINRREFLARTVISALALSRASLGRAAVLDASVLGANTAMPGFGLLEAVEAVRALGFPAVEIHPFGAPEPQPGVFPGFQFDRLAAADKRRIREALTGFRCVTTHLPFIEMHFFSRFAPVAEFSIRQMEIAMEATAFFGATVAVAHVTAPSWPQKLEDVWPDILQRFRQWGDAAARGGFKIAIETGYPASVRDFVRLVKEIGHDAVGAAIDVGHQVAYADFAARVKPAERNTPAGIAAYNDVMHEILDALGRKIIHFHVHDVDPKTWKDHRPLGTGVVNYPRLLRKLKQIGYGGLLIFELESTRERVKADLADSKRRLEAFLAGA